MRFCGFICFCRLLCGVSSSRLGWCWGCRGADGMYHYRYALIPNPHSCSVMPTHAGCLQSTGFALTIGGYFLGHMHGGRKFLKSAHGTFANIVMIFVAVQLALGIYLKLHIHERSIRPYAVVLHGIVGKAYPIIGWTQMLFGAIAYMGYCRGGHLGQCLAHYIMVRISVVLALLCLMQRCLFLGKRLHRLCYYYVHHASCRRGMDTTERQKSRVLRFSVITLWVCPSSIYYPLLHAE
jgi:hypothetical protein